MSEAKKESAAVKRESTLIDLARVSAKTAIRLLDNASDALTIARKRFLKAGKQNLAYKTSLSINEVRILKNKILKHIS